MEEKRMKLADLSQETLEKIKTVRWDRIIEKHEGPWCWDSVLEYHNPEFLMIDERPVLLPVDRNQHPNIAILRTIWGADNRSLTLFLRDTTYCDDEDPYEDGYIAVCDRMAGEGFFLAILYHEWFVIERSIILES
jgi:hypothetical protein